MILVIVACDGVGVDDDSDNGGDVVGLAQHSGRVRPYRGGILRCSWVVLHRVWCSVEFGTADFVWYNSEFDSVQ